MNKVLDWLQVLGLAVMMIMAVLPLLDINEQWMRWAFAAGAAMVLVSRLLYRYNGRNLRIRRLYRMGVVSALLYCASAAMMFWSTGTTNWIAFLMAGAVLQMYASYMIDRENKQQ